MKKKWFFLISILWIFPIIGFALDSKNYIILESTKLKKEVKEYINHYSSALNETTNIDYYVIISNKKKTEEEITQLEEELNMSKNGILLIGIKETSAIKVRLEGNLGNVFTKKDINSILEKQGIANIKKNNWNRAMKNTYIAFYKKICDYYQLENEMELEEDNFIENNQFLITLILVAIGIILTLYACNFFKDFQMSRRRIIWIDYFLIIIIVSLNISILVIASEMISSLALIPIIIGEFTTVLLFFQDPGRIKTEKRRRKRTTKRKRVRKREKHR